MKLNTKTFKRIRRDLQTYGKPEFLMLLLTLGLIASLSGVIRLPFTVVSSGYTPATLTLDYSKSITHDSYSVGHTASDDFPTGFSITTATFQVRATSLSSRTDTPITITTFDGENFPTLGTGWATGGYLGYTSTASSNASSTAKSQSYDFTGYGTDGLDYISLSFECDRESAGNDAVAGGSCSASASTSGYGPEKGKDGDTGTYWTHDPEASPLTAWWEVDLGANYPVDRIRSYYSNGGGGFWCRADVYAGTSSNPGTQVATGIYTMWEGVGPGWDEKTFSARAVRYIRFTGFTRGVNYGGVCVFEVEVYLADDGAQTVKLLDADDGDSELWSYDFHDEGDVADGSGHTVTKRSDDGANPIPTSIVGKNVKVAFVSNHIYQLTSDHRIDDLVLQFVYDGAVCSVGSTDLADGEWHTVGYASGAITYTGADFTAEMQCDLERAQTVIHDLVTVSGQPTTHQVEWTSVTPAGGVGATYSNDIIELLYPDSYTATFVYAPDSADVLASCSTAAHNGTHTKLTIPNAVISAKGHGAWDIRTTSPNRCDSVSTDLSGYSVNEQVTLTANWDASLTGETWALTVTLAGVTKYTDSGTISSPSSSYYTPSEGGTYSYSWDANGDTEGGKRGGTFSVTTPTTTTSGSSGSSGGDDSEPVDEVAGDVFWYVKVRNEDGTWAGGVLVEVYDSATNRKVVAGYTDASTGEVKFEVPSSSYIIWVEGQKASEAVWVLDSNSPGTTVVTLIREETVRDLWSVGAKGGALATVVLVPLIGLLKRRED